MNPTNKPPILQRYGVHSYEQQAELERAMREAFRADAALAMQFKALIMRYSTEYRR